MWWLAFVCLLGGCDFVFGLKRTPAADAGPDAPPFDPAECPASYIALDILPGRYRFIDTADDYLSQASACRGDHPTLTHLAILQTVTEAVVIDSHIDSLGSTSYYWVGLRQESTATEVGAAWLWLDEKQVDDGMWALGEPDDGVDGIETHEEDFALFSPFGNGSTLVDAPVGEVQRAICECDGIVPR